MKILCIKHGFLLSAIISQSDQIDCIALNRKTKSNYGLQMLNNKEAQEINP